MKRDSAMEGIIDSKMIETLREKLSGALLLPGDEHYEEAAQAWNLDVHQHPSFVVKATCVEDIVAAVQFADRADIGVGVMSTGHGIGALCDGGLLINISGMRGVKIDPVSRIAKVEAGALWKDVIPAAQSHGLAGLVGSAPHIGVVGYTLGGGFGYLGRKYGMNSDSGTAADIVTADGKVVRTSADENAELFWALKGSVGNFGIVVSLEFKLYPITSVYGGSVFYPIEIAPEALRLYARWTADLSNDITAAIAMMNIPPLPSMPEPLRGKSVIVVKGCYCGEDPMAGETMFDAVRKQLGVPIVDTFRVMPIDQMDTISRDPVDPMGLLQYCGLISDLSTDAIVTLIKVAGAGSGSPLSVVELRCLGGALHRNQKKVRVMGTGNARFSMNALGSTATPEMAARVRSHLNLLAIETREYQTGETFINFMEVAPSADRVRSAYTTEDWEKLVALKGKYDPKNTFRFNRNIRPS